MVGKNVCHTVKFDAEKLSKRTVTNRAAELFDEAGWLYFSGHTEKKFHDPTAACLLLHPEIGTWVRGKTVKMESGWTTNLDPGGDLILAEIDYDKLWESLMNFT